jgi:hypothetical protein
VRDQEIRAALDQHWAASAASDFETEHGDMLVAILTTKFSAMPKNLSPLSWLDDFLYFPEVLYALFFIWLICSGPGKFSVDYWLAGKLLR